MSSNVEVDDTSFISQHYNFLSFLFLYQCDLEQKCKFTAGL